MKIVLRFLLILSGSTIVSALIAQGATQNQLTQQADKFRDGLYLNFDMLKRNSPIPSTWIETDLNTNSREYYKEITKASKIIFFDDIGVRTYIATDSIWGYCHRGGLHINLYGDFHKIDHVGRISHFIARKSTFVEYEIRGTHPNTIHFMTIEAIVKKTGYLVDLVNDKVTVFDAASLERVLRDDPQLLDEFMRLKKRQKEKLKYGFLMRYNVKYPLYIPVI